MEAVLLYPKSSKEVSAMDSPREAGVGRCFRHFEAAPFGERTRKPNSNGGWIEIVVFIECLVFYNFDFEVGFGFDGVGRAGSNAVRNV